MRQLKPVYTFAGDTATYARQLADLMPGDTAVVTSTDSGPGLTTDPALMQHIAELATRNVNVLGYVYTGATINATRVFGSRTVDGLLDDIVAWDHLYGVRRVFVDEWPPTWGSRHIGAMWGAVRGYAGKGSATSPILVVNPGRPLDLHVAPPAGTLVVTSEGVNVRLWKPAPWEVALIHDSINVEADRAALVLAGWQWGFVTSDGRDGNPYDGIIR